MMNEQILLLIEAGFEKILPIFYLFISSLYFRILLEFSGNGTDEIGVVKKVESNKNLKEGDIIVNPANSNEELIVSSVKFQVSRKRHL